MTITRQKLVDYFQNHIPNHIKEDYDGFVTFLKAYYEYLDDNKIEVYNVRDIDETLDDFLKYFKNEVFHNVDSDYVTDQFLVRHVRDIYLAKGNETSYNLLFKILFGNTPTLVYPRENILKASDSRWNKDKVIFIRVIEGDIKDVVENDITIHNKDENYNAFIQRYEKVKVLDEDENVVLSDDIFQIFIRKDEEVKATANDVVRAKDSSIDFLGKVMNTVVSASVFSAGRNFRVGEVYDANTSTGYGVKIKVIKIDENGGIKKLQIIRFGTNYDENFYLNYTPIYNKSDGDTVKISIGALEIELEDTFSISESGRAEQNDYVDGYVAPGYVGTIFFNFTDDADSSSEANENDDHIAQVSFQIGAVGEVFGFYETPAVFLSDNAYLEDGNLYQTFSYIVKIDQSLDKYEALVKKIAHSAGMTMFGEYEKVKTIESGITVKNLVTDSYVDVGKLNLSDEFEMDDDDVELTDSV